MSDHVAKPEEAPCLTQGHHPLPHRVIFSLPSSYKEQILGRITSFPITLFCPFEFQFEGRRGSLRNSRI